jgi:hypothetical protein
LEKEAPVANEATYNQSQVDALVEAAVSKAIDEKTAELADSTKDLSKVVAERDEQIVALTEARDKAETSLKDYVKAADAAEVVALVDDKYIALANVDATVKLGEDEMSPRQILESIFKDLPKKVNLSEESDGDDPTKDVGDEGTAGEIVDAKARALMGAKDGLSYSDAYTQVLREDPDLKERYFKQEA